MTMRARTCAAHLQINVFTMSKSQGLYLVCLTIHGITCGHVQNDVFTMSKRQTKSHEVRLALAYALAQSIKLSVYEGRVLDLVSWDNGFACSHVQHACFLLSR